MPLDPTRIRTLTAKINEHHRKGEAAARERLTHYLEAGRMLLVVRKGFPNGGWLDWRKANVKVSQPQTSRYMKFAELFAANNEAKTGEVMERLWRLANGKDNGDDPADSVAAVQSAKPSGRRPDFGADGSGAEPVKVDAPRSQVRSLPLNLFLGKEEADQFDGWLTELGPVIGVEKREQVVFEAVRFFHQEKCRD